jgi:putative transposase
MARALRIQYPGALYHVTNRGNERKAVFKDDVDRNEFLVILSRSIHTYGVILHSFVLMDNHWHMLAQTPLGNLSEFMRHFNITYTSHFNRRHKRVGHLYQGRYKSFLVEFDSYLSKVSRYIHLNPVKVSAAQEMPIEKQLKYLWGYKWSSLPGYIGLDNTLNFVEYKTVLAEYGGDTKAGKRNYMDQIINDLPVGLMIREQIVGQSILGSERFVSMVKEKYINNGKDRERPDIRKIQRYLSMEAVLAVVEKETGMSQVLLSTGTTRQVVMTALYNFAGLNNREIGDIMGVDYSTVSQGRKRLRDRAEKDQKIRLLIKRIKKKCQD